MPTVPMIPAALFAMLATVRLGAMHAVVFGGFAPASLAQRIEAAKPRVIMTASCAIEGAKGPLDYRPFVEGAIEKSPYKPSRTIIWQRDQKRWDPVLKDQGQRNWQKLMKSARHRSVKAEAVPIDSNDGIYIIYTSGESGAGRLDFELLTSLKVRRAYQRECCEKQLDMLWASTFLLNISSMSRVRVM